MSSDNDEQRRQYQREYYQRNKEKLQARSREYSAIHPERRKEARQRSWQKTKTKRVAKRREWLKTLKGCLSYKIYHLKKKSKKKISTFLKIIQLEMFM